MYFVNAAVARIAEEVVVNDQPAEVRRDSLEHDLNQRVAVVRLTRRRNVDSMARMRALHDPFADEIGGFLRAEHERPALVDEAADDIDSMPADELFEEADDHAAEDILQNANAEWQDEPQPKIRQPVPAPRRVSKRVQKKVDKFSFQRFQCVNCGKVNVTSEMANLSGLSYCSIRCFHA